MNKSILFLGGSGFFGKSLLNLFIKNKLEKFKINKLILVSNKNNFIRKMYNKSNKKKEVKIFDLNLLKVKDLPLADYVVHAAEYVNPKKIIQKSKKKEDIKTLKNVFKILSKRKFKNSKILYISSGAVYSNRYNRKKIKLKENSKTLIIKNSPLTALDIYVRNKLLGEKLTIDLSKKFKRKTSIVRCFSLIGKFLPLKSQFVLGNFINSIIAKKPIRIFETSSNNVYRSYLYSDDLIVLLLKILNKSSLLHPIFNVGSDKPISIWSLAKFIEKKYKLKFIHPKQQKDKFDYYVPNIEKIKKTFKFRKKIDLKKSIKYTLSALKNKN